MTFAPRAAGSESLRPEYQDALAKRSVPRVREPYPHRRAAQRGSDESLLPERAGHKCVRETESGIVRAFVARTSRSERGQVRCAPASDHHGWRECRKCRSIFRPACAVEPPLLLRSKTVLKHHASAKNRKGPRGALLLPLMSFLTDNKPRESACPSPSRFQLAPESRKTKTW